MSSYIDLKSTNFNSSGYVVGNVVRAPEYYEEQVRTQRRKPARARRPAVNRRRMMMLAVISVMMVAACIFYLKIKSDISIQAEKINSLESQISALREENNDRYNRINESINLNEVRNRAVNELGMTYVKDSQVITYKSPQEDYVNQREAIPGVSAR